MDLNPKKNKLGKKNQDIKKYSSFSKKHSNFLHIPFIGILFIAAITFFVLNIFFDDENSEGTAIASVPGNYFLSAIPLEQQPLSHHSAPEPASSAEHALSQTDNSKADNEEDNRQADNSGTLRKGESFEGALQRNNISQKDRNNIIASLKSHINLRKLQTGSRFETEFDENDEVKRFTFEAGPVEIYEVTKDGNGYKANQKAVELECRTTALTGEITGSLFASFMDKGESISLIYDFADIFASKLDFNTETQQGDRFAVLVDKYYSGENLVKYGKILYARYEQTASNKVFEAFLFDPKDGGAPAYFDRTGNELGASFIRSPVPVGRVTSTFTLNRVHPILGVSRPHLGVDLAAPIGTPIMAVADGKVVFAGDNGGFGKQIIIQHRGGYRTHYGHLSRFDRDTRVGSQIQQKEIIGYVGSTGMSTGPHLDYRMEDNGVFKNPFSMEFKPKSILTGKMLAQFKTIALTRAENTRHGADRIVQAKMLSVNGSKDLAKL